jgi:hypothetical protein
MTLTTDELRRRLYDVDSVVCVDNVGNVERL